ncbi:MAG: ABC transporter substrate-binding protein [Desulfobulbus sp.]|nr:ABC transporter substrate-binding protein [Desulfobulbus sp.]
MRLKLLPFTVLMTVGMVQLSCARFSVAADRLAAILESGTLRVCIWPDYYGISFRNPKTNQLSGIDVDMAKELAHDLGPTVQARFIDSSFAQLIDDLTKDRCDIAMFGIGIIPSRAEKLRFTKPHLQSDVVAITTRSNRRVQQWEDIDQPGRVVAVAKDTLHEPLMRQKLQHAELVVLDTPFAREQEVESGRADVFMADYPYSQRMLANSDWARLIAPTTTYHITPYAYAMAKGDDLWFDRVEQFVASTKKDGRLLAISKRYHLEAMARLD